MKRYTLLLSGFLFLPLCCLGEAFKNGFGIGDLLQTLFLVFLVAPFAIGMAMHMILQWNDDAYTASSKRPIILACVAWWISLFLTRVSLQEFGWWMLPTIIAAVAATYGYYSTRVEKEQ